MLLHQFYIFSRIIFSFVLQYFQLLSGIIPTSVAIERTKSGPRNEKSGTDRVFVHNVFIEKKK